MSEKSLVDVAPRRNSAKTPPIAQGSGRATEAMKDHPATLSSPPRVTAIVKFAQNQCRFERPNAGNEYTNVARAPIE